MEAIRVVPNANKASLVERRFLGTDEWINVVGTFYAAVENLKRFEKLNLFEYSGNDFFYQDERLRNQWTILDPFELKA